MAYLPWCKEGQVALEISKQMAHCPRGSVWLQPGSKTAGVNAHPWNREEMPFPVAAIEGAAREESATEGK